VAYSCTFDYILKYKKSKSEKSYFTGNEEQFYDSYNANLTFLRIFLAFEISILEDKTEFSNKK
jgi:hypothetical protein